MAELTASIFEVAALSYSYPGSRNGISEMTFNAAGGKITAIVGDSGSGKSTLLACLGGVLTPQRGNMRILDAHGGARLVRSSIVTQSATLFEKLNVWENVAVAWGSPRRSLRRRACGILEEFGVAHLANAHPSEVSFGQRQRVAIASAVAGNTEVVLADEPTGGLDADNANRVAAALRAAADGDRVVIVVTHDDRIAAVADHVIRIENGHIS